MQEVLKQYKDLKIEIKELRYKINKLENKEIGIVSDTVKGSDSYNKDNRIIRITGYDYQGYERKKRRLKRLYRTLTDRLDTCEDLVLQIEEFINNIPDSKTRRVFQYRYIDGLEWLPISMRFGKTNESYSRMIHERYLEKMEGLE